VTFREMTVSSCSVSLQKNMAKWQCAELVFGMCLFSSFGQGADYPDRLFVVFV
jgi:hypothetical protein